MSKAERAAKAHAPVNKPSDYSPYDTATNGTKWWTSDPSGEHILQSAATGLASYTDKRGLPAMTVIDMFKLAAEKHPDRMALKTENMGNIGKGEPIPPALPLDQWKSWTWSQYFQDCRAFAKACLALGFNQHQSVNIFGFNTPEWAISLFGTMMAGGKVAGIYPSDNQEQVRFKTDHADGVVAVVEDDSKLNKYKAIVDDLPSLKAIVCWACDAGEDIITKDGRVIKTYSFDEFIKFGAEQNDTLLDERLPAIKPGHCCVLIYTSGTTGNPKAVMISHDAMIFTVHTAFSQIPNIGNTTGEERHLSYLPLSHVAGLMIELVGPMAITSNIFFKGSACSHFARIYDLKLGSLVERLKSVKPTMFLGVPRVWEKIMEKLKAVGASSKGLQKFLGDFAKKRGAVYTSTRQMGEIPKTPRGMTIANVILNKIKAKLGLDKCKFSFGGAAPMTRECLEFFGALGINVNEVYGMSESCGLATWSTDENHIWGSCGYEPSGVEVKILNPDTHSEAKLCDDVNGTIDESEQGELCFRGRNVMMGYLANPRLGEDHRREIDQKNMEAIDANGWMHSGDKGSKDKRGMLRITGRYKELIIGAGGENIAPIPIEDQIKRLCPFVSNAMMIGNKRKFNVMLITLKTVGASGELPGTNELFGPAATLSSAKTIEEAMDDDAFSSAIERAIFATNNNLEVVPSNAATVQKFTILPRDFSVLTGEFTATLKLKRQFVDDEFKEIIDKMYTVEDMYVKYTL